MQGRSTTHTKPTVKPSPTDATPTIPLSLDELRGVAAFAARSAERAIGIFEEAYPDDPRPRAAIAAARKFAAGGARNKELRVAAIAAHAAARAAAAAGHDAAADAARSAGHAAASAYLHPLAKATQTLHILGSAAHAARAIELSSRGGSSAAVAWLLEVGASAGAVVVAVLSRYPTAPAGGRRKGELLRELDRALRARAAATR